MDLFGAFARRQGGAVLHSGIQELTVGVITQKYIVSQPHSRYDFARMFVKRGEIASGKQFGMGKRFRYRLNLEKVVIHGLRQGARRQDHAVFLFGPALLVLVNEEAGSANDPRQQAG
ncbi:MAG TPA: hypothetical protein VFF81_09165 [Noviherbaspirillum sp.]|nr:hypothetical protein [Noviherbaspirillum sp.]